MSSSRTPGPPPRDASDDAPESDPSSDGGLPPIPDVTEDVPESDPSEYVLPPPVVQIPWRARITDERTSGVRPTGARTTDEGAWGAQDDAPSEGRHPASLIDDLVASPSVRQRRPQPRPARTPGAGHVRHAHNPVDRLARGLPEPLRSIVDWTVTIVGAVVIVLVVKAFVINPYRIPSSSMETTLHCAQPASGCASRFSDRVLANRFLYYLNEPRRGDIIVFETPPAAMAKCGAGGTFVKRLIGLPGETVEVRLSGGDGYVYINGRKLAEPYIEQDRRSSIDSFKPFRVPADAYFMMGDNRAQSCDSRVWGSVPRANLVGKVFATYWPPNRLTLH